MCVGSSIFRTPAGCRFGDRCRFRHDDEATIETLFVHLNTGTVSNLICSSSQT